MIHSGWHFTDILVDPALKQLRFSRRILASTKHSQNSSLHYVAESPSSHGDKTKFYTANYNNARVQLSEQQTKLQTRF